MGCWLAFPPSQVSTFCISDLNIFGELGTCCHPPFSRTTANSISLHHPKAQLTGTCFKALVYLSISILSQYLELS